MGNIIYMPTRSLSPENDHLCSHRLSQTFHRLLRSWQSKQFNIQFNRWRHFCPHIRLHLVTCRKVQCCSSWMKAAWLQSSHCGWILSSSGIYTFCELKCHNGVGPYPVDVIVLVFSCKGLSLTWGKYMLSSVNVIIFFLSVSSWARECHWGLGRGWSTEPMVRLCEAMLSVCNFHT